ncbi:LutC/YkgG family protein [Boudabousia marimammalium]|uniref:Lactate utilization protein B/C n=1 Tax=Boudabousia marimammalium TaxID=156892 RepID=A0A1Q5PL84_9ACTO|nr:lactate utilization protein C [Boudabousia marimammalium]OKL47396.1 lactate utilization protein B/C [Boudabousia marimammalium]
MSSRQMILSAVKMAIAKSQDGPAPLPPRDYRVEGEYPIGAPEVIAEFVETLEDYNAKVTVVAASKVAEAISEQLHAAGATSVVVPHGLDEQYQKAAAEDGRTVEVDGPNRQLSHLELDQIDAVVTRSRCGISLSGTIVLDGTADQGRRALSLVPDTHVCVVEARTVMPTVPQAVELLGKHPERASTWIAGPSATSDIELIRVDGVHGPRNLYVIIIED